MGKPLRLVTWLAVVLLAPVAWIEVACRGTPVADTYTPLIADPAWQRPESRTYTTYPEWHIVYAYQDYAEVIRTALSGLAPREQRQALALLRRLGWAAATSAAGPD